MQLRLIYIFVIYGKALKNIERHLCDLTSVRSVHTASAGDQQVSYDMHTTGYLKDIYVHSLYSLGETYFGALHQFLADATGSDTPWGSKSSGTSIQIASNSVRTYRGPVAIDMFSSLIFTLSVTEIQLCKVNAHFPLHCTIFACNPCSILQIHNKF